MSPHPSLDDLADAAEGLLDPDRTARVADHLEDCASCQAQADRLSAVTAALAALPAPAMPSGVAARLDTAVAQESGRRREATAHPASGWRPVSLGSFRPPPTRAPWWRRLVPVAATVVAASVVGFAGYLGSAAAGTDEPPLVAVGVDAGDLPAAARSVAERADLSPHRFSRAWFCARQATDGRITGLAQARWSGTEALLVYTRVDGGRRVSVVTGCAEGRPTVVDASPLPR